MQAAVGRQQDGVSCLLPIWARAESFTEFQVQGPQDERFLPPAPASCRLVMRRPERVADILREEISQIVGYELQDPRVTAVTVTEVRVSENLRAARVYVTVAGDEEEHRLALKALRHAAPFVREQIGLSLNLPRTPEIYFVRDTVEEQGERVDKLLDKIEREWESKGKDEG